ncbi:MAG TPA: tail fiber domain-containing protein [Thermomicrobiales bacterium]|nr:tail fiber domain-containing protein [Thermomicrobiales bacterium]
MDSDRFDTWTRRLAGARSRRAALALLGAAALTEALPADPGVAGGLCALKGGSCRTGADCCSGRCHRRRGARHGHCRCSRNAGTACLTAADCCVKHDLMCVVGQCELPSSDRARKRDLAGVDPADMLARTAALPIATWSYTFDDPSVRHVGPMAQDFAAAFGVGADDRHIHPIDGQGVALAAIQGLYAEVQRLQSEQAALQARLAALEASGRH